MDVICGVGSSCMGGPLCPDGNANSPIGLVLVTDTELSEVPALSTICTI